MPNVSECDPVKGDIVFSVGSTMNNHSCWVNDNRDFAFFVFERTKHQPRRNLSSYLVLQRLCNEVALSPGIDAFWY